MNKNIDILNQKIANISKINCIFERLKKNDNILLKKIRRIRNYDESILKYTIDILNEQNKLIKRKKKKPKKNPLQLTNIETFKTYKLLHNEKLK